MIKEAIILAGGLGTRLRSVVSDLPKCMAPVNGVPFIAYVINHLRKQGITHFIFSLGYKSDSFIDFLASDYKDLSYQLVIEEEPLGTGGAIKQALLYATGKSVVIANGDTLFKADIVELSQLHELSGANCTMVLKPMTNIDRYGAVEINEQGLVQGFKEKQFYASGLINGGVYALNKAKFFEEVFPDKFSFESAYLQLFYKERTFLGLVQDKYFIDIGIPEDYKRAQDELLQQGK